jgi:hypothetical protein
VISDQYAAIVIRKKNGEVVGRVANLNGPVVQVVEDMLEPGKFTRIQREDIDSIEHARVSMMPPGLLNSLQLEEVQDLVAFLLSRGAGQAEARAPDTGFVAIFDGDLNHCTHPALARRSRQDHRRARQTAGHAKQLSIWRGATRGFRAVE